jgi:hypothetical protein
MELLMGKSSVIDEFSIAMFDYQSANAPLYYGNPQKR